MMKLCAVEGCWPKANSIFFSSKVLNRNGQMEGFFFGGGGCTQSLINALECGFLSFDIRSRHRF